MPYLPHYNTENQFARGTVASICLLSITDRLTDIVNFTLNAHRYRESSPKISPVYLQYQQRNDFPQSITDELTDS